MNNRLMRDQSKKASSLNLRLSASRMSLVSLIMLPMLCMVGSIAVLGTVGEGGRSAVESAVELGTLRLPATERRRLERERVPNLDNVDPTALRGRSLESLVRPREIGERIFSFSGLTEEWLDRDCESSIDPGQRDEKVNETGLSTSMGEGGGSSGLDTMTGRWGSDNRGGGVIGACSEGSSCKTSR